MPEQGRYVLYKKGIMVMKRTLYVWVCVLLVLGLAACGASTVDEAQDTAADTTVAPDVVVFADPLLEAMVREVMGKPEGDITLEEAEAVTKMELGIDWQQEPAEGTQIKNISGIENFKNLEELGLHFHAITDISPLAGLNKLTSLSLGGNPVADITPLSGLTNLGWLTLFNCQAQDYTPLANLTGLGGLLMDHSTISDVSILSGLTELWWLGLSNTQVSDVSPLTTLVNLKQLQLAGCPITDYSPLAAIYPNLEDADFTLVSSLRELGFAPIDNAPQVESYKTDEMYIQVNHKEWGEQENKDNENAVILCKNYGTEKEIEVVYYPDSRQYLVFSNAKDFRYTYDSQNDKMNVEYGGENADAFMEEVYDEVDPYPMMTPIRDFSSVMTTTFGVSADILYNLPREEQVVDASSLAALGFIANQDTASYLYEKNEPQYYSIQVQNPEWGSWEEGGDVSFFTPLSDEYRIVVTYSIDEKKFLVKADDNDGGGASFEFFMETREHVDGWCSDNEMTVEEYFKNAFNDTGAEDVYLHSVELMINYIKDTFGMSIDELFALPVGE
jgi:hypothetical protein